LPSQVDPAQALDQLLPLLREGGVLLQNAYRRSGLRVEQKAPRDFVTDLDLEVERQMVGNLRRLYPDWAVLAEEGGLTGEDLGPAAPTWIVDPLDGTANFIHGIPHFAISVALAQRREERWELLAGAVYNPIPGEMYSAVAGNGAYLNERRLQIEPSPPLADAFLTTGFPIRKPEVLAVYLPVFNRIVTVSTGVRRLGSAALDLCYTAAGNFHGFWEPRLGPWDVAAGALILQEAGGRVIDFAGGDDFVETGDIIGGGDGLVEEILAIIQSCR